MEKVYLLIILNTRTITIPFKSIKALDTFTETYKTKEELSYMLNEILALGMEDEQLIDIHVMYPSKGSKYKAKLAPVKYAGDIVNMDEINDLYIKYVLKHYKELLDENIGFKIVAENYQNKLNTNRELTESDIIRITTLYLKNNYRRYRDAYFILKREGKISKKNIDTKSDRLTDIVTSDEYIDYLAAYAKKGDEEYVQVLDILASYDLETLKEKIGSNKIVDGMDVPRKKEVTTSDIISESYALEDLTGMKIDELDKAIKSSKR